MKLMVAAGLSAVVLACSGCYAVAGIVEVTRGDGSEDPMGVEYVAPDGAVGWYCRYPQPANTMRVLHQGMVTANCAVQTGQGRLDAACWERPPVFAVQDSNGVFRLCPAGTDRMQCRMGWELVHKYAPEHFDPPPKGGES
jgi:hypothetical protein